MKFIGRIALLFLFLFLIYFFFQSFKLEKKEEVVEEKEEMQHGYVTFWFDDGLLSTYEIAFPELEKKGWKGVVAVVADYDTAYEKISCDGDVPMEMEKIRDLEKEGWEISSHSMTHSHLNIIENEEVLEREIAGSKKMLEDFGINVSSFTFPYGEQGRSLGQNIVSREYPYWRSSMELINEIPAYRHVTSMFVNQETTIEDIKEWIKEAEKGGWLVIGFHGIIPHPQDYWQQTPEFFLHILELISSSNLEPVLPEEIFKRFGYAEGYLPKTKSNYEEKIIDSDFQNLTVRIIIPEIEVDTEIKLVSSLEEREINFDDLDDYPVLISEKESPFLSFLGDYGTSLVIGHRNLSFRNLDKLKNGDEITVSNGRITLTYFVSDIKEIKPDEIWKEVRGNYEEAISSDDSSLILMTCTPYGTAWRRLLVFSKKNMSKE